MTNTSRLHGAELSFFAERVDIPLAGLSASVGGDGSARLERPDIVTPQVSDELEIAAVRELALKELLRHADSGRARVRLKLSARSFRVGPLAIELREGTEAIIDLEVKDAAILRETTKGTLEPPISLPLGMTFRGLYLNDDGDVIADIAGFPDVNLSQLTTRVPRIPATLDELIALVFEDRPPREGDDDGGFDASGLLVEARDVIPRLEPLHLGDAGELLLGPDTRLDVDFAVSGLAVRGRVQVLQAHVRGVGFDVEGLAANGSVSLQLDGPAASGDVRLDATCFEANVKRARLTLRDGSHLELGPSSLGRSTLELSRAAGGLRFHVRAGDLHGALERSVVVARIGGRPTTVELSPTVLLGHLSVSESHVEAELGIDGAAAACRDLALDLGIADAAASLVSAKASGQLKAGTDFGVAFTGELLLHVDVESGSARLGELQARLAAGSDADLRITQIAASEEGLDALVAEGDLRLRFHSGQLPLGPKAAVRFSSGAQGRLSLTSVELRPGQRWPTLRGRGHVEAGSDPAVLFGELVELPRGSAAVHGGFSLDENGHLTLEGLSMALRSVDADGVGVG